MVSNDEAGATLLVHFELLVCAQKIFDGRKRAGTAGSKLWHGVYQPVLHEAKAPGRDHRGVAFEFFADVRHGMITVEDNHDRPLSGSGAGLDLLDDFVGGGTSQEVGDARMGKVMEFLDVNGDDFAFTHEVKEVSKKKGGAAAVRAAFDEQHGLHFGNGFLDRPQIEDVLPDRIAQPTDFPEIAGPEQEFAEEKFADERRE